MRRHVGLAVSVVVVTVAALAGTASPAYAFDPGPAARAIIDDTANWSKTWRLMNTPAAAEIAGTATAEAETALTGARVGAATLPAWETVGSTTAVGAGTWVLPAAGALIAGFAIGTVVDNNFLHVRARIGEWGSTAVNSTTGCSTGTGFTAAQWMTPVLGDLTDFALGSSTTAYRTMRVTYSCNGFAGNVSKIVGLGNINGAMPAQTGGGVFTGGTCGGTSSPAGAMVAANSALQALAATIPGAIVRYAPAVASAGCMQAEMFIPRGTFNQKIEDGVIGYHPKLSSETATTTVTGFTPAGDPGASSTGAGDVRTKLKSGSDASDIEIAKMIDPTFTGEIPQVGTITLPEPDPDEAYDDYLGRLRAMGWLGTATTVVETTFPTGYDYDPRYGPGAPTRITIRTGSPVPFPAPGYTWPGPGPAPGPDPPGRTWPDPDNPPTVQPQDPVIITRNPPTQTTAPGGPGVVPPAPDPGTGSCGSNSVGSLDITPITGLDYGSHFPFGVFSWAGDQLALFDTGPTAPSWAINVPSVGADYEIDLDPFSPYMDTMRTVLAWVLWIGTVWFVATSLLGVRGTGNPADAIDDYLDQIV